MHWILWLGVALGCGHSFTPTARYTVVDLAPLRLRVSPELAGQPALVQALAGTIQEFEHQAPPRVVEALRGLTIWVETGPTDDALAGYHGAFWVLRHHRNPDKADAIEIADARLFLQKSKTNPLVMFHELAHAYLARSPELQEAARAAFAHAVASKRYEHVRTRGGFGRAYAIASYSEYFAVLTEAYEGTSGEQPFDRAELASFDPLGYEVMLRAWATPGEHRTR